MMVAYKNRDRAVFLYGFAKNDRDNIDPDQVIALRKIAAGWLEESSHRITQVLEDNILQEIDDEEDRF